MYIHRGFVVSGAEWRQAPDDGMVVEYDADDPRFAGVGVGEALRFAYRVVPEDVGPVLFALGGGPRLLSDGHVSITGEKERFQPDVLRGGRRGPLWGSKKTDASSSSWSTVESGAIVMA